MTHGPEWSLHEQAIVVTETFRPDVEAKLERVIDPGEWIAADLHVHASPSPDSNVTLEDRVASLVAEGIGFAVPTDHNHVTDYAPAARELGLDESTFLTTCGIEATTTIPHFGHFNAYPVSPDEALATNGATIVEGLGPTELFARLRTLGPNVVVQVNHPRMEGGIGYFDCVGYDPSTGRASGPYSADYDLLEVWNGFDLARGPVLERVFGEWLAMVARGRHVTAVGNSDSHQIRYEWAGYPRTYVRTREHSPLSIVASLRAGHAFVTSGPFLEATVGAAGPGDVAPTTGGQATVRVRVRTPRFMSVDRVEIWMGAAKVRDERLTSSSPASAALRVYEASFAIPVEHDTGLVVLVRGDTTLDDYFGRAKIPPVAFTNPIWIDADGDEHGPTDPGDPRVEEHRNVEARRAR